MGKILVVDDEAMMRRLAERILSPHYEVVQAASGEEAIQQYAEHRPDMVLSDVMMEGMSGYELISNLHRTYHTEIPVMFMTADDSEDGESRSFETGAVDYIKKPFKADVLLRRVENIMRQQEVVNTLKVEANTDLMTGLLNKASAKEEFTKACQVEHGSLLMIDLDSFKLVNDIYGHEMGDDILIAFADILRNSLREGDIIGRMGGDEFSAFCFNLTNEKVIMDKAAKINDRITAKAKELMGEDMQIPLGASIGAIFVPRYGTDYEDLMKKADKMLYNVKQNGKHGCVIYSNEEDTANDTPAKKQDIHAVHTILRERNDKPGAYETGFENFQAIYRFLHRSMDNYHKKVAFLIIDFMRKTDDVNGVENTAPMTPEEKEALIDAAERFRDMLYKTLRKSDVAMCEGDTRFMALLPEANAESAPVAVERVLSRWRETYPEDAEKYFIKNEIEDLDTD